MNKLEPEEERIIVKTLKKLKPGFLPEAIFLAIARIMVIPTCLVIPLYRDKTGLKVQLLKRAGSDPVWPNMWNLPGKIILATDKTITDTQNRIIKNEIPGGRTNTVPIFCGYVFDKGSRGKEISIIYYFVLNKKPKGGKLFDVNNLPKNIIKTERPRIMTAIKAYSKSIK